MIGLVLAGGKGTRLHPITYSTPKHLLPIYNKPLIYYSLYAFKNNGIKDIGIVVNHKYLGHFKNLLGAGNGLGLNIHYLIEKDVLGIIHAVSLAYKVFGRTELAIMFGDNIFEDDLSGFFNDYKHQKFEINGLKLKGAKVILKEVNDPERFGVCEIGNNGKIISLVEKPKDPKTNLILTGLAFADQRYFDFYQTMKPSARGEYEYPDFLKIYLNEGTLTYGILKGRWFDTGTFDALLEASNFAKKDPRFSRDFF